MINHKYEIVQFENDHSCNFTLISFSILTVNICCGSNESKKKEAGFKKLPICVTWKLPVV